MIRFSTLVLVCATLLSSGCASLTSPARMHELKPGTSYWMDYDATRRGTLLASKESNARSCSEPSPDVAMQMVADMQGKANYQKVDLEAKGGVSTQALKLAERSQMLMFFREALYRVCEISLNTNLASTEILALYERIIETSLRLGSEKAFDNDIEMAKLKLQATALEITKVTNEIERAKLALQQGQDATHRQQLEATIATLQQRLADLGATQVKIADEAFKVSQEAQQEARVFAGEALEAKKTGETISNDPVAATAP